MRHVGRLFGLREGIAGSIVTGKPPRRQKSPPGDPPVKRPEVDGSIRTLSKPKKPRKPRVCGFRDGALHVEVECGLCRTRPDLSEAPPAPFSLACHRVAQHSVAYRINVNLTVRWPMTLEVVEKRSPIVRQGVLSSSIGGRRLIWASCLRTIPSSIKRSRKATRSGCSRWRAARRW
jgi:hypothetical protein